MLVLSRKRGEKIVMPQCSVSVTVIKVQGNVVRLGISAPPEVAVHRDELWREICAEGFAAAEAATAPDSSDEFTAELTDAAYQIALRRGLVGSWLDLELGLWKTLAETVKTSEREWRGTAEQPDVDHQDDLVELGRGGNVRVWLSAK
jgi:carbon storage regulator